MLLDDKLQLKIEVRALNLEGIQAPGSQPKGAGGICRSDFSSKPFESEGKNET